MKIGNQFFCDICGKDMTNTAQRKNQKYCSQECARIPYDAKRRKKKTALAVKIFEKSKIIMQARQEKFTRSKNLV